MIRVNLLSNRREPVDGLEAAIAATGASAFINRREIVLGGLFLVLGAGILYLNSLAAGGSDGVMPLVASASEEAAPRPAERPSVRIEPARAETVPTEVVGIEHAARLKAAAAERAQASVPVARPELAAAGRVTAAASRELSRETAAAPIPASARELSPNRPLPKPAATAAAALGVAPSLKPAPALVSGEFSALNVSRRGDGLQILATIGTQPAYQMFRLNSPNRVVVDLSGVTLALPASQRQLTPSHPLVERIRVAQFQVSPPKVRMVFDVSEFPEISITPTPTGLAMQVAASAP